MSAATSPTAASAVRALAPQEPSLITSSSPTDPKVPSLTQKTWVIPPRPKPGRKPATDTPASKRKAQNRVAQRAFRERKAAKVGELEEQMTQMTEDHQGEVQQLTAQLNILSSRLDQQLSSSVNVYDQSIKDLQLELETWKKNYAYERKLREGVEKELAILKGEAVSLPRRGATTNGTSSIRPGGPNIVLKAHTTPDELPLGCNRCSLTHCQCLAEVLNDSSVGSLPKRPISPSASERPLEKKSRSSNSEFVVVELDIHSGSHHSTDVIPDGCGFCSDGTTCLCAELAAERQRDLTQPSSLPSPPGEDWSQSAHQQTEIDFTHAGMPTACPTGPGTCDQCRNDPTSKGFCKGLAAMNRAVLPLQSSAGTVSCASAFKQLKQHPAFGQASKNFNEWLPRLTTVPKVTSEHVPDPSRPAYTAFEIESASVLGVLKFFDRKFGMES